MPHPSPASTLDDRILAAIDLGSNSFHLLIARVGPAGMEPLQRCKQMVQLARDQDAIGCLAPAAIERATLCLRLFRQLLDQHGVERFHAVGTEALRRCPNRSDFLADWDNILGGAIEIITAGREAELTFIGLSGDPQVTALQQSFMTVDIGGASTELCYGSAYQLHHWKSLPLGCLALGQQFFTPGGPLHPESFATAETFCQQALASHLAEFRYTANTLCLGAAGTMRVISELIGNTRYDVITSQSLAYLKVRCCERGELPAELGEHLRWDVIPAGIALLSALLTWLADAGLQLSDRGIKEGILHNLTGHHLPSCLAINNTKIL